MIVNTKVNGGSNGGPGDARLHGGPNSFNFMQFYFKKLAKLYIVPPEGWRPHFGEILDPPLQVRGNGN